eukprot:tig00020554_g10841.t1
MPEYCGEVPPAGAGPDAPLALPASGSFLEPYTRRDCRPVYDAALKKWASPGMLEFYADQVYTVASAHFMMIVHMQLWHVFSVKTRKTSIFAQGFANAMMNFSLLWGPAIVLAVVFIPGLNTALNARPLNDGTFWLIGIPFGVALMAYNEGRRWWGRRAPRGWIDRTLNW